MRALSWLKDLFSSERGNVLVVGAATMPLLIGSAAFAIDTIQISVWKRQLQRAADSSAIAGAYALSLGDDEHDAVHRDLDKNAFPLLTQEEAIAVGPRLGFDRTVRVTADRDAHPALHVDLHQPPQTLVADATAALVDDGTFCMVSLYDGTDAGIDVNGGAVVDLDLRDEEQLHRRPNASPPAATPRSRPRRSPRSAASTAVRTISSSRPRSSLIRPPQADPFAYLPNPAPEPAGRLPAATLTEATDFTALGAIHASSRPTSARARP